MSENYNEQVNYICIPLKITCNNYQLLTTWVLFGFQLKQVEQSIKNSNSKDELNELISLRDSLVELIALTSDSPVHTIQNPIDDEYALFKVKQYGYTFKYLFSLSLKIN